MCIGVPMQVVSRDGFVAHCQAPPNVSASFGVDDETVDLSLVGECEPGTWVLVFLGAAREVLTEATALQMLDALSALQMVSSGDNNFDHLFADLVDREPQLPDHLKDLVGKPPTSSSEKLTSESEKEKDEFTTD